MLTSLNNQKIKSLLALYEKKEREKTGCFLVEGCAEVSLAQRNGIKFVSFFYCSALLAAQGQEILEKIDSEKIEVDKKVYERIAYRGTAEGILAIAKKPEQSLAKQKLKNNPLVIVIEKVEKPGNIGAILRTADAAGADAVLVAEHITDLYNPNVVRASLGAIFSLPVIEVGNQEALTWLKQNNVRILATTPGAQKTYSEIELRNSVALLIGSEKDGLSDFWLKNSDEKILIPMSGQVNSLNASVSAAIVIYEAVRQRSSK